MMREYINIVLTENAIEQFASLAHDEWRRSLPPNEQNEPRMRSKNGGPKADINVPFDQLHPTAQQENLAAGQAAAEAVSKFPNNLEQAAEYIHIEWMKRNPQDDYNAAQHKSYDELPEIEKEKDRVHVRTMMKLMRK
jgi:CO/xanthine dehydrogenase Mo-binding subunit